MEPSRVSEIVEVTTTAESREEASRLARLLVDRRLAACVQVSGPIESLYRWKGAVERTEEWVCVAKTTRAASEAVVEAVRAAHPYDVPQIVAAPVAATADYGEWVASEVAVPGEDQEATG